MMQNLILATLKASSDAFSDRLDEILSGKSDFAQVRVKHIDVWIERFDEDEGNTCITFFVERHGVTATFDVTIEGDGNIYETIAFGCQNYDPVGEVLAQSHYGDKGPAKPVLLRDAMPSVFKKANLPELIQPLLDRQVVAADLTTGSGYVAELEFRDDVTAETA